MSNSDDLIKEEAMMEARRLKKEVVAELCDTTVYPPDSDPVSVFMAGSPGAGKTESSQNLISSLSRNHAILRIDADDFRNRFSKYNGANSQLFQAAASILADSVQDCALRSKQSFIFDGTLSKQDIARKNIQRSLDKDRFVQIVYVYQDPIQAWKFVKIREAKDGRHIPADAFIQQYFQARENVNQLKKEFGPQLKVDLIVKDIDGTDVFYKENIDAIDSHIPERYSKENLLELIRD